MVQILSKNIEKSISKIRGAIFDLDGVVYLEDVGIKSTIECIQKLSGMGICIGFLTNSSNVSYNEIKCKLMSMGISLKKYFIMTSAIAAAKYCKDMKYKNSLVIGGWPALTNAMLENGCCIANKYSTNIDSLVVGYATEFSYNDLLDVHAILLKGAAFIGTDKDRLFATKGTPKPGTGWIISAIEYVSGIKPLIVGKPNDLALQLLLQQMMVKSDQVIMIGDSFETDIAAAKKVAYFHVCLSEL